MELGLNLFSKYAPTITIIMQIRFLGKIQNNIMILIPAHLK